MPESNVIALKYRPQTFQQLVGQEAIVRTLTNAVKAGAVHHAYLFAGARGVGKTTTARILAKALNCVKAPTVEPCGRCAACIDISNSSSNHVREIDAASNTGVDNVRDVIIASAAILPPPGQYKIFIIDEVHQLSASAFNALLKTIEEPPPRVVFIMATTELQKVPDTIISRCQVFEFPTLALDKVFGQLKRIAGELGVQISDSALATIARAGEGSMRDAESALDQVISFAGKMVEDEDVSTALGLASFEVLERTIEAVAKHDGKSILAIVEQVVSHGYNLRNFCRELMTQIRTMLVINIAGLDMELVQMPEAEAQRALRLAAMFSEQDLVRFFSILSKTEQDLRMSSQPRFQLEIGLIKLAEATRLCSLEDALFRLSQIESSIGLADTVDTAARDSRPGQDTPKARASLAQGPADPQGDFGGAPGADEPAQHPAATGSRKILGPEPDASWHATAGAELNPQGHDEIGIALECIRSVLEQNKKRILASSLTRDQVWIDGDALAISVSSRDDQATIDQFRPEIEEACANKLGHRLILSMRRHGADQATTKARPSRSASSKAPQPKAVDSKAGVVSKVTSKAGSESAKSTQASENARPADADAPENHPAVRAVVEAFQGEIIDVNRGSK